MCRIQEKKDHQLSFKQVASGFISRGYLDPTDGQFTLPLCINLLYFLLMCVQFLCSTLASMFLCGLGKMPLPTRREAVLSLLT